MTLAAGRTPRIELFPCWKVRVPISMLNTHLEVMQSTNVTEQLRKEAVQCLHYKMEVNVLVHQWVNQHTKSMDLPQPVPVMEEEAGVQIRSMKS